MRRQATCDTSTRRRPISHLEPELGSFFARLGSAQSGGIRVREIPPAALGRSCASVEARQNCLILEWDSSSPLGSAGLFDPLLGGDCVLPSRPNGGGAKPTRLGIYRQHGLASCESRLGWFGRHGYRCVSGYEPYRADLETNRLQSNRGPWLLLPSTPEGASYRKPLKEVRTPCMPSPLQIHALSNLFLSCHKQRTRPRLQSCDSWPKYCPTKCFAEGLKRPHAFDTTLRFHITDQQIRHFFRDTEPLPNNPHAGTFGRIAEISLLWRNGLREWLPFAVDERSTVTLCFKLKEISPRIYMELLNLFKTDWLAAILTQEQKLSNMGYVMRAKGELQKAEIDSRFRESELLAIRKLVHRCMTERSETEAAELIVQKEHGEAVQAYEALKRSIEILQEAEKEANADGVIDQEEEKQLAKLKLNLQIAEARNRKEQREFEEAHQLRMRESQELVEMESRLREREVAFTLAAEEARASSALLNGNKDHPSYSVMNRIYAYESIQVNSVLHSNNGRHAKSMQSADKAKASKQQFDSSHSNQVLSSLNLFLRDDFAVMMAADGSGYNGDVVSGRPEGHGVEWYAAAGLQYVGQFCDDLRHGLGALVFTRARIFYAGEWAHGARNGRGAVGFISEEGVSLPIAWVVCRDGCVESHRRFACGGAEAAALMKAVQEAVDAATAAASHAAEARRSAARASGEAVTNRAVSFRAVLRAKVRQQKKAASAGGNRQQKEAAGAGAERQQEEAAGAGAERSGSSSSSGGEGQPPPEVVTGSNGGDAEDAHAEPSRHEVPQSSDSASGWLGPG